ncbi:MAG: tetratricopeptide repeat protein [Bacteroidota bacterium]
MNELFSQLKLRNVRKTMTIYGSSALTTIGVIKLLIEVYAIGALERMFPVVVTVLLFGVASAFIFAWFHGKEGSQRFQWKELLLHAMVVGVAVAFSYRVGTSSDSEIRRHVGKSIAVLPFTNTSGNKEDEYFSDGITEDILTQLAKINDLRVIAHATVVKYKDTKKTPREIGKELGVSAILTGGVRRDENRIRISGQLISTESDEYLWAEAYDREFKNIFAIQSEVARHIADGLRAHMTTDEVKRVNAAPTTNLEAYALYLRGRDHGAKETAEDNGIAIGLLEKAIALDPQYALAYAELGLAYRQRYIAHGYPSLWADSAVVLGRKATELDPASANGYHTMGRGYEALGKYSLALQSYNKAIELSPNHAGAISGLGWVAFNKGNLDEALAWMRKSVELAPDAAAKYTNVGLVYNLLGEDSLALHWFNTSLELQPLLTTYNHLTYFHLFTKDIAGARKYVQIAHKKFPDDIWTLSTYGDVELMAGNFSRAREHYEKCVQLSSYADGPGNQLAFTLPKLGETKKATVILDSNLVTFKRLSNENPEDYYNPFVVATIFAMQNNPEDALSWLRIAVERGYVEYRWLNVEPMMDSLRDQPDFRDIMAKLQVRLKAMHHRAQQKGLFLQ